MKELTTRSWVGVNGLCAYVSGVCGSGALGLNQRGHEVFWGINIDIMYDESYYPNNDAPIDLVNVSWTSDCVLTQPQQDKSLTDAYVNAWNSARNGITSAVLDRISYIQSADGESQENGASLFIALPDRQSMVGEQRIVLNVAGVEVTLHVVLQYHSDYTSGYGWAGGGWNVWYEVDQTDDKAFALEKIYSAYRTEFVENDDDEDNYSNIDFIYNATNLPDAASFDLYAPLMQGMRGLNVMQLQGTLRHLGKR